MRGDRTIFIAVAFVVCATLPAWGQTPPCDTDSQVDAAGALQDWSADLSFRMDLRNDDGLDARVRSGSLKLKYDPNDWLTGKLKLNFDHALPRVGGGEFQTSEFELGKFFAEGYLELSPSERFEVTLGLQPAIFGIRSARNQLDYQYNPARKAQEIKQVVGANFTMFYTDEYPLFVDRIDLGVFAHHVLDSDTDANPGVSLRMAKQFGNLEAVASFAYLADDEGGDTRAGIGLTYDLFDGTSVYGEYIHLDGEQWKSSAAIVAGVSHNIGSTARLIVETTYLNEGRRQVAPGIQWEPIKNLVFGFTYRRDICGGGAGCDSNTEFGIFFKRTFSF